MGLVQGSETENPHGFSTPIPVPRHRRILVVDDDIEIRAGMAEILRDEGYDVETVADGAEAMAAVAKAVPALIILDLMMPVMTGQDVLQELEQVRPRIPVVVVTAAQYANRVRGLPVFVKPINVDDLLNAARKFVA